MVASLKVIAKSEMTIEFTSKEIAALRLPGISLGNLVVFRDKMEKIFKLEPIPTQYRDGFVDRIFEITYISKLMNHKEILADVKDYDKEIWSWIWHILKDEFKFDSFVINMNTGEMFLDNDNATGCKSD